MGTAAAQSLRLVQTIRGSVTDVNTGQPLPGATVTLPGTEPLQGTATDENGNFRLTEVPIGRHTVRIRMLGYDEQTLPDVLVSSGKQAELNVRLAETLVQTREVEITDKKNLAKGSDEMNLISARSFSPEEMLRYAGNVNDPARMVTNFPGVQGDPSNANNNIIVRGNSPRGLLWRMEGMEMPNPNHFSSEGASGGAISMLNPNVLRTSDFLTGAFPAQYGNATSGVFDLGLRKGNADKREYTAQAGIMGIEAQAEGPFHQGGKGGSYLANYRYSTTGVFKAIGFNISGDATPVYQDGAFKIWLPVKRGSIVVYGMGGYNGGENLQRDRADRIRERDRGNQGMWTTGVRYNLPLNPGLTLETNVNSSGTYAYLDIQGNPKDSNLAFFALHREKNTYANFRLAETVYGKLNAAHTYRFGVIASSLNYRVNTRQYNYQTDQLETYFDQGGSTFLGQAFAAWQYRPSESVTLNAGLHSTWFALNKQVLVEPRLSASWQAAPRHTFSLGVGLHSRVEPISLYFVQVRQADGSLFQPNRNLGISRSAHAVASHLYTLREGLNLKTEAYYQHLFQVPVGVDTNGYYSLLNQTEVYTNQKLVNEGQGRNYGMDIGVERTFRDGWYVSASQALFRSEYKTPSQGWKYSRYDNRYVTNLIAGKEFVLGARNGKQRTLLTNFRFVYTGGFLFTPLDMARSEATGSSVYDNNQYNSRRGRDFTRVDFSIGIRTNRKRSTQTLKLDVQNALNQQTILGEIYNTYREEKQTPYSFGIIPNLSYRVEF